MSCSLYTTTSELPSKASFSTPSPKLHNPEYAFWSEHRVLSISANISRLNSRQFHHSWAFRQSLLPLVLNETQLSTMLDCANCWIQILSRLKLSNSFAEVQGNAPQKVVTYFRSNRLIEHCAGFSSEAKALLSLSEIFHFECLFDNNRQLHPSLLIWRLGNQLIAIKFHAIYSLVYVPQLFKLCRIEISFRGFFSQTRRRPAASRYRCLGD